MSDRKALQAKLTAVNSRIAAAAKTVGRTAQDVRLIVVTKGHPAETIRALYELGVREIGESYVQEGLAKQQALGSLPGLRWHMIGHVQSRKAVEVAKHFDLVHSLDSVKLAQRLDRAAAAEGETLPVLLECNVSGEDSKYGWPAWGEAQIESTILEIEKVLELPNVVVRGLMSMAPMNTNSSNARQFFERIGIFRDSLAARFPKADWSQLSMGMSDDFEAAVLEGATIVRIGNAILGNRDK